MTTFFTFYKPEYNPTGMSGTVGGSISTNQLLPRKDTLFCSRETSELISVTQYRKVFAKQTYNGTLSGVRVELANVEYSGQISFGITTTSGDSIASPTVAPTSVSITGNYAHAIALTGSYTQNSVVPIWIKQTIAADTEDDDFVSFQLRIIGTII